MMEAIRLLYSRVTSPTERECPTGFLVVRGECIDFDECKKHNGFCYENLHCMNTVGSYNCGCRSGYTYFTKINWDLFINEPYCVDIDECMNEETCPKMSACKNTDGSYICQCTQGFGGHLCEDIDECNQTSTCDENAVCLNTEGNFICSCNLGFRGNGTTCKVGQCEDRRCPPDQKCVSPTSNECQCNEGFNMNTELDFCEDLDECLLDHDCDKNSTCVNKKGSFSCVCDTGYVGDGRTCVEGNCTDEMCPINAECVTPSSSECRCKNGFEIKLGKSNEICVDTDECSTLRRICHKKAVCMNIPGGYECNCQEGYFGDGQTCFPGSCTDINCPPSSHKECVSTRSNLCKCTEGYEFNNLSVCVDVDECKSKPCGQNAECANNPGNYSCTCNVGYVDCSVDKCATGFHDCHSNATCKNACYENVECANITSNYNCICKTGFAGDGVLCTETKTVLVLHTQETDVLLMDAEGRHDNIPLSFGTNTTVFWSCSVTYRNRFYVFGGNIALEQHRQISEVTQCELRRIGTLDFGHRLGACSNVDDRKIYLCFSYEFEADRRQCRSAVDPLQKFTEIAPSTYNHTSATAASSSKFEIIFTFLSF